MIKKMIRIRRSRKTLFIALCSSIIGFLLIYILSNLSNERVFKENTIINYSKISLEFDNFIQIGSKKIIDLQTSIGHIISKEIGGYRLIPDTRDNKCRMMTFSPPTFATVSVIIVFHNEERSILLRTITSILWRTNLNRLSEIILIDDFSKDDTIIKDLEFLPPKLFVRRRNIKRKGVLRSLNYGASIAKGIYLMFLSSRCEVNQNWLEPLISRMHLYPGIAVSPVLDFISEKTFDYNRTQNIFKGGFDWSLNFKWIPISEEELEVRKHPSNPFVSPALPSQIFMISRKFFNELEGFNTNLQDGGESLEMSLKSWLCDGIIEIVPCSRVGYVFPSSRPLTNNRTQILNSKIVAESWMDEFKHIFYLKEPMAKTIHLEQNLGKSLKTRLQCKQFSWYLKNVFPELDIPFDNYTAFGQLYSGTLCLKMSAEGNYKLYERTFNVYLETCHKGNVTYWFYNVQTKRLSTGNNLCLSYFHNKLTAEDCKNVNRQKWIRSRNELFHRVTGHCLDSLDSILALKVCRRGVYTQIFNFSTEENHSN